MNLAAALFALCMAAAPARDATTLAVQADAAHDAGRLAVAADLYTRAYRAMTPDERIALGEVMVAAALDDLRASWESKHDVAFAEKASALLAEYERDSGLPLPDAFAEHRAWIERAQPPASEPVLHEEVAPIAPLEPEEPAPARQRPDRDAPERDRDRDVGGPIAIGFGVAAVVGGAVMAGIGAPLGRRAERAREQAFSDPRFSALDPAHPETIEFVDHWSAIVEQQRLRTHALVSAGAVLVGVGIGVAVYGAVRLVRHRRGERVETARIHPIPGGVAF